METKELPRHKKNPAIGTKSTAYASEIIIDQADAQSFSIDEEVSPCGAGSASPFQLKVGMVQITLMDWGNAIVRKINKTSSGIVESIAMDLHLEGDFKKTEKKITWLATSSDAPKLIEAELVDFDYLLTKKKIEEDDDWLKFVTPVTEFRKEVLVDSNCGVLQAGTVIQFERKGYYILDSVKYGGADGKVVIGMAFFLIPDGKVGTVASKADKGPASSAATAAPVPAGPTKASSIAMSDAAKTMGASRPTPAMYSVKAVNDAEAVGVDDLKMYKVKPIY